MTKADTINGAFELSGAIFLFLSVRRLHRDKTLKGASPIAIAFFAVWGCWNLYFYSGLDQWMSFYGSVLLTSVNAFYLFQIAYYSRKEHHVVA